APLCRFHLATSRTAGGWPTVPVAEAIFMAGETGTASKALEAIDAAAAPTAPSASAEAFYAEALHELSSLGVPFLLAGTYALSAYTGIGRATKDLDILCKPSDYPRILTHFRS